MRRRSVAGKAPLLLALALAQTAGVRGEEWPTASPAERGLEPAPLAELVETIRQGERYPDVHSLLIVRHGDLVLEEYFAGWSADRLHTLQSVSKSFTSALVGIAIDRGEIEGVDEKVLDFFPDMEGIRNLDERKRAMTIEDLLTMRSGTDYHESPYEGSPHWELNHLSRGWDRFYLDRPMTHEPGTHFLYDSGGVILLSSLLERRTGLHADAYAERHLFPALGIGHFRWSRNAEGHPHTGGGLDLRPRDMAKFGLLYLRQGRWGERQVVPAEWVEASLRRQVELDGSVDRGRDVGYGYLWWVLEPGPGGSGVADIYAAQGFMGQYIFLVPEHDLVVVVTAGARGRDQLGPVDFLYRSILPSVRPSAVE